MTMENDKIRQSVIRNYAAFAGDVDPDLLSDYLIEKSVISIDQWQDICGKNPAPRPRCRALLNFLLTGSDPRAFLVVRDVLKKNDHYLLSRLTEATELQQACQTILQGEIPDVKFSSSQFELEDLLDENGGNLVGELLDECNLKPKKRSKKILLAELSNENDLLRKEIENERSEKQNLQSTIEHQRINANRESQNWREELIKKEANYNNHVEKLKQELDNNKITCEELQVSKGRLKQEFDAAKSANNSLQVIIDKLVEELQLCKATLKAAETNSEKLMKKLGEQRYKSDPVLVQTIRTAAAKEKKKVIYGLAILDKELFVVHEESSEVEVYDSIKFSFSRRWNLMELIYPLDITSCIRNKCLYISHYKGLSDMSNAILRVDPNGNLIKNWSTGVGYCRLSVSAESTVILASYSQNKLNEYSPNGQLIREINLSSTAGIRSPLHAIKLTNGHFLVSHGDDDDDGVDLHEVCIVDSDGKFKTSFVGKPGSAIGQMNHPVYLSVDANGFVMVADYNSSRVLLLDPDLEFKKEILSKEKHGLRYPERILLDESNDRLFVADNASGSRRILVFDQIIL